MRKREGGFTTAYTFVLAARVPLYSAQEKTKPSKMVKIRAPLQVAQDEFNFWQEG